jgi:hypothetical protein
MRFAGDWPSQRTIRGGDSAPWSWQNALQRAFDSAGTVGSPMVGVGRGKTAAGFYAALGFVRLPDSFRLVADPHGRRIERA